jgi:Peptidase A4 family
MFRRRSPRHPQRARQPRRARTLRARLAALGGCAAALLVAYCMTAPRAERAVSASSVSRAGTGDAIQGGTVQGGTAQAGGWGRGGYPMMPGLAAGTVSGGVNAAATTSANWAGYAVTGTPGTFTRVSGSWTQPPVTCGAANAFSSFWAGLDGDGTQTVEQTGTEADCSGGAATYAGWYEIFPDAPVFYDNPVQPGDSMSASVTAVGGGAFILTLTDATQGWTQTTHQTSATAQLGSAEVIAEAPSNGTVLPLANFGTVNFTSATVGNTIPGDADPAALTMVSAGGITEATPSALTGGNSFTVTWDNSGAAAPPQAPPGPGANMTSPSPSPAAPVTASAAP